MAALCALFLTNCQKELDTLTADNTPTPALASGNGIFFPDQYCGASVSADLSHDNVQKGEVTLVNNNSDLYLAFQLNQGIFIEGIFAEFETASNAPTNAEGDLLLEEFDYTIAVSGSSQYTLVVPLTSIPNCNDLLLSVTVSERNMFGQVTSTYQLWVDGTDYLNGFYLPHCIQSCN